MGFAGLDSKFQGDEVRVLKYFAYRRWRNSGPLVFVSLPRLEPSAQVHAGSSASHYDSDLSAHLSIGVRLRKFRMATSTS